MRDLSLGLVWPVQTQRSLPEPEVSACSACYTALLPALMCVYCVPSGTRHSLRWLNHMSESVCLITAARTPALQGKDA